MTRKPVKLQKESSAGCAGEGKQSKWKQGSGAEDSVGLHSGRPVLMWSTIKIWIA